VASKNPRTVTIEAEAVTRTEFDIVCRGPVQGRIAFVSDRDAAGFGFDIFVRNADGTGLTNLTKTPEARERRPAWSPNGKRIAFDNDFSDDAVNLINPDGSGRTTLHTGIPGVWGPKWSPDGNKIAFLSVGPTGGLGVINVDGSRPILIASSDAIEDFAWSPDGRKVAFGRLRFDPSTVTAIWIVNSDGNGSVQLTADRTEADLRVYGWSPDGRWIAFVAPTPGRDGEDIYLVDPATKAEVNITNNPDEYPSVAWSPDGSTLAFTRKRGGGAGSDLRDIFTIKADGSGLTNITNAPDAYGDVEWSPDGQRLVFVFGFFALDIINADGSDRRLLTADTLSDFEPSWGP
jgi:TolB protein